jgi:hypothetical protein
MQCFAALNYSILHYTITYYSTRYITLHYDAPNHTTLLYTLNYTTLLQHIIHCTELRNLYYTTLYCTMISQLHDFVGTEGRRTYSCNTFATRRYKEVCASAALHPRKDLVHIVQEAEWAPGPVWTAQKISAPPRFDHRPVHHVTSPYNHYAIPAAPNLQFTVLL